MAVKSKAPRKTIPTDSLGDPDIYVLRTEQNLSLPDAAEKAGISGSAAFRLYIRQEVEHNPDQVIKTKGVPKERLGKQLAKLRNEGIRWERLAARTGFSKTEVMNLVAEAEGVDVEDLKRARGEAVEAPAKSKGKAASKPARGKAKAAPVVDEDDEEVDDEDEEDEEDEEPTPAPKARRGRARK